MERQIDILASHQVDKQAWDQCIRQSASGLIYASFDYLDHLADNWCGIIINDYESVLPVPFRQKLGIKYCYDVPFMPQLGLFSYKYTEVDEELLKCIFSTVQYGDYNFNFLNQPAKTTSVHHNYVLSLRDSYADLKKNFSKDVTENIHKAEQKSLQYQQSTIDETIDLYIKLYASRSPHVTRNNYERFRQAARLLEAQGKALTRKVIDSKGNILSTILLLKDERRLYNIMNSTTRTGRKEEANYFLLSEVWKEFQQSGLIFDFEGSDIPGIKQFYKKFGANDQPYRRLHFNHLPAIIKWLKK